MADAVKKYYEDLAEAHAATLKVHKEWQECDATTVRPAFQPMTPERLREYANAMRKRNGLPPLPEMP
jgi:hypothetical protein